MAGLVSDFAIAVAKKTGIASAQSDRRSFLKRGGKVVAGAAAVAAGIGASKSAAAAYSSYVIASPANGRSGPGTGYGVIALYDCPDYLSGTDVSGSYACGCNECTTYWFAHPISSGTVYIHRGNMNPYTGGACECG